VTTGCQVCCIRICGPCAAHPAQKRREEAIVASRDGHLSGWVSQDGLHQPVQVPTAKCKSFVRMVEKVMFESDSNKRGRYECLKDISRATIVCESMGVVLRVLAVFLCLDRAGQLTVVSGKNRFANPTSGGWADIMLSILLPTQERGPSHICEIQVVHKRMLVVRTHLGAHSDYANFRAALELTEVLGLAMPELSHCCSGSDVAGREEASAGEVDPRSAPNQNARSLDDSFVLHLEDEGARRLPPEFSVFAAKMAE